MNTKALSIPSLRPKARATAEAWGKKGHSYKSLPIRFPLSDLTTVKSRASETPRYTSKSGAVLLTRVFVTR